MKKEVNYELINNLYMSWLNERDPFQQRRKKEDIKSRISPYELLMYSSRNSFPFTIFRRIFSLSDLFETLEDMEIQGEDIRDFTNQPLLIETPEDIRIVSNFSKREMQSEVNNLGLIFKGSNVFEYGDIKNIGESFPNAYANNLSIEQIEQMSKSQKDYKGIPITVTIDNIGELPLEKLADIEKAFDVDGIKIVAQNRAIHNSHQGECTPLNLSAYKQIRKVVDDEIISKLYVDESLDKMNTDIQLTAQIIDKIVDRVKYDFEAAKKPRFSKESKMASGLVGLLTGKSICKGYAEIFRNVESCVGIDSTVIDGLFLTVEDGVEKEDDHSWNQVKLGDIWFNADLTAASNYICEDKASGDLFMSDIAFYGDRRKVTFEKGKELKGKSLEATVIIGGHIRAYGSNNRQCKAYIAPAITSNLIQKSRLYDEEYKRDGNSTDYKGVVPYVGSKTEKDRLSYIENSGIQYE